jgi:site-specific recombinase XerD
MHSQQALLNIPSEFSKHLELRGCTKVTIECYLHDLSFFIRHLNKNILEVERSDIQNYLFHLKHEHDYKNSSLVRRIAFLRSFYRFLNDAEYISSNPAKGLKFPRVREKPIPFLSESDVKEIVEKASNQRDRLIIKMFFFEGLRLGELRKLSKRDIDFTRGRILVNGKGEKQRIIPLHKELTEDLKKYVRLFSSQNKLFPMVSKTIHDIVRDCASEVGIHCYPHLLRHSFGANLYKKTKNVWLVSKMLGHSKLETTVKYLRSLDVIDDFSDEYQNAFGGILS